MQAITTIGLDIGKSVFQVQALMRPAKLRALGHTVRLMPPAYVKPYVKRQKCVPDTSAVIETIRNWKPTRLTPEQESPLLDYLASAGRRRC